MAVFFLLISVFVFGVLSPDTWARRILYGWLQPSIGPLGQELWRHSLHHWPRHGRRSFFCRGGRGRFWVLSVSGFFWGVDFFVFFSCLFGFFLWASKCFLAQSGWLRVASSKKMLCAWVAVLALQQISFCKATCRLAAGGSTSRHSSLPLGTKSTIDGEDFYGPYDAQASDPRRLGKTFCFGFSGSYLGLLIRAFLNSCTKKLYDHTL